MHIPFKLTREADTQGKKLKHWKRPSLQFDRLTQEIVRKIQLKLVQTENWLEHYTADISSRC